MENKPDIIQSFVKLGCKCSFNGYHLYDIQKWLREEKKLDIIISSNVLGYGFIIYNRYPSKNILNNKEFQTYEEALEAGIWEAYYLLNN